MVNGSLASCSTQQNLSEPFAFTSARLHTRHSRSAVGPHFVAAGTGRSVPVRFRKARTICFQEQSPRCRCRSTQIVPCQRLLHSTQRSTRGICARAVCARTCSRGMRVGGKSASRLSSRVDSDWCRAFAVIFKGAVVNFFCFLFVTRSPQMPQEEYLSACSSRLLA